MSALTKKHPIKQEGHFIHVLFKNKHYCFPEQIAEQYCLEGGKKALLDKNDPASDIFAAINEKYSKPGALFKGLRIRENVSQKEMAKKLNVTQSDISQMENGKRPIGKIIAKRVQKVFDVDYRLFLA